MENSSSSKTRSPARVLAALLAVVMLFIVMPVLPAGAEGKVELQSITILGAKNNFQDGDDVFFNPNGDEVLNDFNSSGNFTNYTWTGAPTDLQAQRSGENVKLKLGSGNFTSSGFRPKTFTFALYTEKQNPVVSWSTTEDGSNGTPLTPKGTVEQGDKLCNVYTLPQDGITGSDIYITVKSGEPETPTYTVTFTIENGATVKAGTSANPEGASAAKLTDVYTSGTVTVTKGQTLCIKPESKKTGYTPVVSVPGDLTNDLKENGGLYTLTNITRDINVDVTLEKAQYTVQLAESTEATTEAYTVTIKKPTANYNESAEFTVVTADGYEDSTVNIAMDGKASLQEKTDYSITRNGSAREYMIYNVTGNVTITVTSGSVKQHTVTVAPGEGFAVKFDDDASGSNSKKVNHGINVGFTVTPETGWETTMPVVTANGVQITASSSEGGSWKYSVEIKADTTISVSNFKRKTYTVTVVNDMEKYSLTNYPFSVEHGQGFTFTLNLTTAYEVPKGAEEEYGKLTVACEGATEAKATTTDGRSYTITVTNVTGNVNISFENIRKKTYSVNVEAANAETTNEMYEVSGGDLDTPGTKTGIEHGNGVNFTITPKEGYRIDSVNVYVKGSDVAQAGVLVADSKSGTYSIGNVTNNYTIKVSASAIPFVITIQSTPSTKINDMEMGATSVTKVYTKKTAETDGVTITREEDGTYKFKLPEVTRKGYTFNGWKDSNGIDVDGTLTFYGSGDYTATVIPQWAVDVTSNSEDAFFSLQLTVTSEKGTVRLAATINTNLSSNEKGEVGSGATVLAHGFLYSTEKDALDAAVKNAGLMQTLQSSEVGGLKVLSGMDNVLYFKQSDAGKSVDLLENGAKFALNISKAPAGAGAAWVLVEIKNTTYLVVSAVVPNNG